MLRTQGPWEPRWPTCRLDPPRHRPASLCGPGHSELPLEGWGSVVCRVLPPTPAFLGPCEPQPLVPVHVPASQTDGSRPRLRLPLSVSAPRLRRNSGSVPSRMPVPATLPRNSRWWAQTMEGGRAALVRGPPCPARAGVGTAPAPSPRPCLQSPQRCRAWVPAGDPEDSPGPTPSSLRLGQAGHPRLPRTETRGEGTGFLRPPSETPWSLLSPWLGSSRTRVLWSFPNLRGAADTGLGNRRNVQGGGFPSVGGRACRLCRSQEAPRPQGCPPRLER